MQLTIYLADAGRDQKILKKLDDEAYARNLSRSQLIREITGKYFLGGEPIDVILEEQGKLTGSKLEQAQKLRKKNDTEEDLGKRIIAAKLASRKDVGRALVIGGHKGK